MINRLIQSNKSDLEIEIAINEDMCVCLLVSNKHENGTNKNVKSCNNEYA